MSGGQALWLVYVTFGAAILGAAGAGLVIAAFRFDSAVGTDKPDRMLNRFVLALTVPVGAAIWMASAAGPSDDGFPAFVGSQLLAALIVGFLFPQARPAIVGFGLVLGPFELAAFTTPRGDGDGLWGLVFPFLVVWGALLTALVGALQRVRTRVRPVIDSSPLFRVETHPVAAVLLIGVLTVGTVSYVVSRWPDPWSAMERALETLPVPSQLTTVATERHGDALCTFGCGPSMTRDLESRVRPEGVCRLMREAVRSWAGEVRGQCPGALRATVAAGPTDVLRVRVAVSELAEERSFPEAAGSAGVMRGLPSGPPPRGSRAQILVEPVGWGR